MTGSSSTGPALAAASWRAHRAGDLERQLARVDLVVAAVEQRDLDVDDGKPARTPRAIASRDALLDRRDELLRDDAADDVVLEDEARARRARARRRSTTWPYWPRPPDLPDVLVLAPRPSCVMVSR